MDIGEKTSMVLVAGLLLIPAGIAGADMVACWDFDGDGGNLAINRCGSADGNSVGDPEWIRGRAGRALNCDGEDDYVDCGVNEVFDINDRITVAAWINVKAFDREWQTIIAKGDSAWRLSRAAGTDTVAFHLTGITSDNNGVHGNLGVEGLTNVDDGQWHHVAGVYDGAKIRIYTDGVIDRSLDASGTIQTNTYSVCIGENSERAERYFNGAIDEVVIFDEALGPEEIGQLHSRGAGSFIAPFMARLAEALRKAHAALADGKPRQAIELTGGEIAEYEAWAAEHPGDVGKNHGLLASRLCFLLARARESEGQAVQDVAEAYKKSVSMLLGTRHTVTALLWLSGRIPARDYIKLVGESLKKAGPTYEPMRRIARDFESSGNWAAFAKFLDAVFSGADDTKACARAIAAGLEADGKWAGDFLQYCRGAQRLRPYVIDVSEKAALAAAGREEFDDAAKAYRQIADMCDETADKAQYVIEMCECIHKSGQSDRTVSELDTFIEKYGDSVAPLVIRAHLLKGHAYLQAQKTDLALLTFSKVLADYPQCRDEPEPIFFMGYCNMLQRKFDDARGAFERILAEHPDSPYALKARLCLRRIERMTK